MRNFYLLFAVQMEDLPTTVVVAPTHQAIEAQTKQSQAGQRKLTHSRLNASDGHGAGPRALMCVLNANEYVDAK